jgi:TetR/AcrR family transcriptional repressor of nem operon
VGRPRTFDEEQALEAAASCFWSRGYEATSIRNLSQSMGIACASLYNAYGGKRELFVAALDHYCNSSMRERITRIESGATGFAAIDSFFADLIERSLADSDRKGCFLVNSAMEVAPHDKGLAGVISRYFEELKGFFVRHIRLAQGRGEVTLAVVPELYAAHLLSVLMGVRVLARCCPDRAFLEAAVTPALRHFRPPSRPMRKDPK